MPWYEGIYDKSGALTVEAKDKNPASFKKDNPGVKWVSPGYPTETALDNWENKNPNWWPGAKKKPSSPQPSPPSGGKGNPAPKPVRGKHKAASGGQVSGGAIVSDAKSYLGIPYQWGGYLPSTGFDCSGLVNHVLGFDLGLAIPTYPAGSYTASSHGPVTQVWYIWTGATTISNNGNDAQAGDLVCWPTHMGIATGKNTFINSPTTGSSVFIANINGFSSEPLRIRRLKSMSGIVTTANPIGGRFTPSTGTQANPSSPCLVSFPKVDLLVTSVGGGCLFSKTEARAFIGGMFMFAGLAPGLIAAILMAAYGLQGKASDKAKQFQQGLKMGQNYGVFAQTPGQAAKSASKSASKTTSAGGSAAKSAGGVASEAAEVAEVAPEAALVAV